MFRWGRTETQSVIELTTIQEYEALLARDLVILFKHSPACGVSWMAHAEVLRFVKHQPNAPVYLVSVRQRRDLSLYIAQHTGVHHASPQVLVFRHGHVVGAASHAEITADLLQSLVA